MQEHAKYHKLNQNLQVLFILLL